MVGDPGIEPSTTVNATLYCLITYTYEVHRIGKMLNCSEIFRICSENHARKTGDAIVLTPIF
jgi:hypothetical protein